MWEQLFKTFMPLGYLWVLWWFVIAVGYLLDFDWLEDIKNPYRNDPHCFMMSFLVILVSWYIVGSMHKGFSALQLIGMLYISALAVWACLIYAAFSYRKCSLNTGSRPQVGITKIVTTLIAGITIFTTVHLLCA